MSQNPACPCLLFALLFDLFNRPSRNPDFGKNGSKIHTSCFTTRGAREQRGEGEWGAGKLDWRHEEDGPLWGGAG